jgi:hypothetical protein
LEKQEMETPKKTQAFLEDGRDQASSLHQSIEQGVAQRETRIAALEIRMARFTCGASHTRDGAGMESATRRWLIAQARRYAVISWDDRGSNPDALAGCRFSHHFGFRRRIS